MRKNWTRKDLGDVCTLQRGFDLPKRLREKGRYPLLSSSGSIDTHVAAKVIGPGVVTGRSGSIGSVFFIDEDFWPLNTTLYVKDFHGNDPQFIFHLLKYLDLKRFSSGAGVPTLNRNNVHCEPVSVPVSVSEQKRIVAILDEVFAGIDDAIANTEKNLTNARELFESYLNAIFRSENDNWRRGKFADIAGGVSTGPFGSLLHKSDYVFDGIPLVNPAHIQGEEIIPDLRKTVSQDKLSRLEAYVLKENDIVIGRRGEIGRCAVITQAESGWLCGTGCFFIRPLEGVGSTFLSHLLRSDVYTSKMESLSTGATMKNLNNKALSDLVIALPTIEEQHKIVSTLENLSIEVRSLKAIYQQKLTALKELKQSILQKAFTGELTADIATIKKEKLEEVISTA